jgi:hypothetical protein
MTPASSHHREVGGGYMVLCQKMCVILPERNMAGKKCYVLLEQAEFMNQCGIHFSQSVPMRLCGLPNIGYGSGTTVQFVLTTFKSTSKLYICFLIPRYLR